VSLSNQQCHVLRQKHDHVNWCRFQTGPSSADNFASCREQSFWRNKSWWNSHAFQCTSVGYLALSVYHIKGLVLVSTSGTLSRCRLHDTWISNLNFRWFHDFKKYKLVLSGTRVLVYKTGVRVTGIETSDSMFYPFTMCALQIVFIIMIMIINGYPFRALIITAAFRISAAESRRWVEKKKFVEIVRSDLWTL